MTTSAFCFAITQDAARAGVHTAAMRLHRLSVLFRMAAVLPAILLVGCVGAAKPDMPLAQGVDINRMYGGWHIIATIPNVFEKGMVQPYDVYSRRPDGDIREDFYVRRGRLDARRDHFTIHDWVTPGTGGAAWRVQVLWPINLPFLVLYVDPDYRYVMFGETDHNLGWIYARESRVPAADYQALLARFRALGYDPTRFRKIVQAPEDIGKPGFWSDKITR